MNACFALQNGVSITIEFSSEPEDICWYEWYILLSSFRIKTNGSLPRDKRNLSPGSRQTLSPATNGSSNYGPTSPAINYVPFVQDLSGHFSFEGPFLNPKGEMAGSSSSPYENVKAFPHSLEGGSKSPRTQIRTTLLATPKKGSRDIQVIL